MKRILSTVIAGLAFQGTMIFADGLKVGAATSNITPPIGTIIVGGFNPYPSTFTHDELHARAVVVDDGKDKIALVICDVLGMRGKISDTARQYIEAETGIPASNVLISATHTHSAGTALGTNRYDYKAELDSYQHFLARRIADAVINAHHVRRDAEMAYGSFNAPEHLFNRRWIMKEGTAPVNPFGKIDTVKMNPPRQSPDLVKQAGPIDPEFSFVVFRESNGGAPIALYSAYSLHYVGGVPHGHVSSDYYGVYCQALEKLMGSKRTHNNTPFVAALANGTSGDINNVNYAGPAEKKASYEKIHEVANDLAKRTFEAVSTVEWKKDAKVAAKFQVLDMTRKKITPEMAEWAKKTLEQVGRVKGKGSISEIYATRVNTLKDLDPNVKVPIQFLRIGDVAIGTTPTETFAETGLEFREKSPFKHSFMVEIAHDYLGYMPTPRHFELGGYETWPGTNHLEPEASVKLMNALIKLGEELK